MNRNGPEGVARVEHVQLFSKRSQTVAGSMRQPQIGNDLYFHKKFQGAGDRSQIVTDTRRLLYCSLHFIIFLGRIFK